jgi:hypothetical protein
MDCTAKKVAAVNFFGNICGWVVVYESAGAVG